MVQKHVYKIWREYRLSMYFTPHTATQNTYTQKKEEKKTSKKRKTAKESLVCNNACYFVIEKGSRG